MGVGGQHHTPAALLPPPGKNQYPLCRRLGGPQGQSGCVRKISGPAGICYQDRPACSDSRQDSASSKIQSVVCHASQWCAVKQLFNSHEPWQRPVTGQSQISYPLFPICYSSPSDHHRTPVCVWQARCLITVTGIVSSSGVFLASCL